MAQQGDRDDLDRDVPLGDEDKTRGMGDEEFEEAEEGGEADLADEDEADETA